MGLEAGASGGDGGAVPSHVNVLTNRYDLARTGANPNETILDTTNVNSMMFGFKFAMNITGRVYGQPLYVSGLNVGGTVHNVVYVATEHNMVYAFDADDGTSLWSTALEPPIMLGTGEVFNPGCADMGSGAATYEVGVTSTPVIDPTAGLIYVVDKTTGKHMLHALSLTTGADVPKPTVVGPATGFSSNIQLNRPGLLLLNGVVYIAFGSHCDAGAYNGWIFGHDATTLALKSTYNTTPTGSEGAIWQGGVGLSSDGTAIWFSVANGTQGGANMGMSIVKATVSGSTLLNTLSHQEVADGDNDLSAGAVLVGNQVLSGGKSGYVIVLNAADASQAQLLGAGGEVHNVATWNGGAAGQFVYTWGSGSQLEAWQLAGGMLTNQQTNTEQTPGHPGGMITISSNGTTQGSAVLWATLPLSGDAWHSTAPGALYAFDAANIASHSLWNSTLDAQDFGTYAKFSPPTVANGKVYVATFSGQIMVYGLK
jgi:outer membrane protein assembly factor BamB